MNNDTVKRILSRTMAATAAVLFTMGSPAVTQTADNDPPLNLKTDGFFSVGGKPTLVNGKTYMVGQMYVEMRIPQNQTHPYPIVMLHGGTRSGTTFTGTPDGREGWAQYFARRGYAVYVVDQPGRGRSGFLTAAHGPLQNSARNNSASRFVSQEKFKLWPQAALHTQWPGNGEPDDPATLQLAMSQLPAIENFDKQQPIVRDALIALVDQIGPSILMTHSQGGAFGWPVADARPDKVKAILAVEPNGPPGRGLEFIGPPDYFKEGKLALTYGITSVPLTYAPALAGPAELKFVKEDKPDGPGLATCWKQAEPARQLTKLKMPIMVLTSEASYHAPYDHCTVKFLEQAGVRPSFIQLADLGIKGNSHVLMLEKNNKEIAAVIAGWLDKTFKE